MSRPFVSFSLISPWVPYNHIVKLSRRLNIYTSTGAHCTIFILTSISFRLEIINPYDIHLQCCVHPSRFSVRIYSNWTSCTCKRDPNGLTPTKIEHTHSLEARSSCRWFVVINWGEQLLHKTLFKLNKKLQRFAGFRGRLDHATLLMRLLMNFSTHCRFMMHS